MGKVGVRRIEKEEVGHSHKIIAILRAYVVASITLIMTVQVLNLLKFEMVITVNKLLATFNILTRRRQHMHYSRVKTHDNYLLR